MHVIMLQNFIQIELADIGGSISVQVRFSPLLLPLHGALDDENHTQPCPARDHDLSAHYASVVENLPDGRVIAR